MAFLPGTKNLGVTLVLRRFHVTHAPEDGLYVEVIGRPEGLLRWLLTTLSLESQVSLRITATDVTKESSGLQGRSREIAPISGIASASVGFNKSLWTLIVGALLIVYGLFKGVTDNSAVVLAFGLLVGGVLLAVYWFSSRLHIAIETNGGTYFGLRFKRSLIENVSVDFEKCAAVIEVLQNLMLAAQARREVNSRNAAPSMRAAAPSSSAPLRSPTSAPAPRPETAPAARLCHKCGTPVEAHGRFCDNCGTRVEPQ